MAVNLGCSSERPHLVAAQHPDKVLAVRSGPIAVVGNQVNGHFPFQTSDVTMTEVVAELVNLGRGEFRMRTFNASAEQRRDLGGVAHLLQL